MTEDSRVKKSLFQIGLYNEKKKEKGLEEKLINKTCESNRKSITEEHVSSGNICILVLLMIKYTINHFSIKL